MFVQWYEWAINVYTLLGLYLGLSMWYRIAGRGVELSLVRWGNSWDCLPCFCEFYFVIYGCALGGVCFFMCRFHNYDILFVTLLVVCRFLWRGSFGCIPWCVVGWWGLCACLHVLSWVCILCGGLQNRWLCWGTLWRPFVPNGWLMLWSFDKVGGLGQCLSIVEARQRLVAIWWWWCCLFVGECLHIVVDIVYG